MTGLVVAVGSSLEGFHYDPKAGRPDRLRKTLRLIAEEVQRVMAWVMLGRGRSAYRCLFVTLTYRTNTKGDPRDVSACLNRMRDWLARQGLPMCPYLWVAELQKRGALHYHLMVWLPRVLHLPRLDRCGWWKHGMTKVDGVQSGWLPCQVREQVPRRGHRAVPQGVSAVWLRRAGAGSSALGARGALAALVMLGARGSVNGGFRR